MKNVKSESLIKEISMIIALKASSNTNFPISRIANPSTALKSLTALRETA